MSSTHRRTTTSPTILWRKVKALQKEVTRLTEIMDALVDHTHCRTCGRPCSDWEGQSSQCRRCDADDFSMEHHGKKEPTDWPT